MNISNPDMTEMSDMTKVSIITKKNMRTYSSVLPVWLYSDILSGVCMGFGTAAGALVCALEADKMRIRWLYVHPDCRRKRVGTALMEELLSRCLKSGIVKTVFCEYGKYVSKEDEREVKKEAGVSSDAEVLRCFLESFVFQTSEVPTSLYVFSLEQAQLPQKAFRKADGKAQGEKNVLAPVALGSLSTAQRFFVGKQICQKGILSQENGRINWDAYDNSLSLVWLGKKDVCGLLLARREEGFVELTDLYAAPGTKGLVICLLAVFACGKYRKEKIYGTSSGA